MYNKVTILGARGSMPVSGQRFAQYGGATTCVVVRLAGQSVILDSGTGIMKLDGVINPQNNVIPLIITHSHLDHVMGLPMCPLILNPSNDIHIYIKSRGGLNAKEQLDCLLRPPLWPVNTDKFPASFSFLELEDSFSLGNITVQTMEGNHPGGVSMVRLDGDGKSVVFATDSVINEEFFPAFCSFAGSPDLLLIDGQYSQREYDAHPAFGHNSRNEAARIGKAIGAKQTLIIHHDVTRTDDEINALLPELQAINPYCSPAYEGQEVIL